MKRSLLGFLALVFLISLCGCGGNRSLFEQSHQVNLNGLTDDELRNVEEGTYSDYFVFYDQEEVADWVGSNPDWGNYELVEDVEGYDEVFFTDKILVVVFATWRAYSQDFFIKNQTFNEGLLRIEIQYHIPWYAFGDSWDYAYGFIVELPYDGGNPIEVEISYVER